ncbi:MAG TPA: hypothetical protein VK210_07370, partial [Terriglobia bacterium]|nr:hypothetical protein [Terriglobia bacterium]
MKPNEELLQKIGQVRKKWKTLLWARGLAWVLGVLVVSIAVGLYLASTPKVPFWLLNVLKFAGVFALIMAVVRTLVLPLRRVPSDEQLARFVQERNPGLEDRLVSAVEAIHKPKPEQGLFSLLVVKDALERTRNVHFGEQINKRKITTFAVSTGALAALLLVGLYLSTLYLPYSMTRFMANPLKAPKVDDLVITVKPGNVTVPKGEDVTIDAVLSGFDPERADINMRYDNGANWETSSMQVVPDKQPTYRFRIFNIQDPVHYFVDAGNRKSAEFTIKVADLPKLEKLDYTYHFPSYTGMPDKKEENGFDLIALKGTTVEVVATGSQPLSGGRIVFKDGKIIPLKLSSSNPKQVMASVTIDRKTTFQIELTNANKQSYKGLDEFNMEALEDQKPTIKFTKPGRDVPATNLEEVFVEVRAEDDFGLNNLDIYYSVNGKSEKKIEIFKNSAVAPKEMSGGHTFFMEEYNLKPGDFVSYYAKASDTNNPANTATSDIYFIEVRPFGREFTQSQQQQGQRGGGGGGGQRGQPQDDSAQALVKREKDILAATFNVSRDKERFAPKEYTDNLHAIAENQAKLAVDVDNVVQRLERRQLTDDQQVKDITELFKKSIEQMKPAQDQLNKEKTDAAKEYESTALQFLSQAAALYTKIQVQQGGGGGGGGGGQGARSAQDLADLFALELDQSK